MEHLHSPEPVPETIPFRNADVLFRLYKQFETDWQDYLDVNMRVEHRRPANFPPVFASRWALAWSLRTMSDQEVLNLMHTWERHPADVESGTQLRQSFVVAAEQGEVHESLEDLLTPEQVKAEGYPRMWRESA